MAMTPLHSLMKHLLIADQAKRTSVILEVATNPYQQYKILVYCVTGSRMA